MTNNIVISGDAMCPGGCYVLRISVSEPLSLSFGRFRGGRPVAVPAGDYLYVGSARGRRGASRPASRLLRHATRSGDRPPHVLREPLLGVLQAAGLATPRQRLPTGKRLHWHIDYLLDETAVELTGVTLIRTAARLESVLARRLAEQPGVAPLAAGLGAADLPGETHLFTFQGPGNSQVAFSEAPGDYGERIIAGR